MRACLSIAFALTLLCGSLSFGEEAKLVKSADQRWASGSTETPEFRRHVVPLFSKLGCNMRSCHGSFQGQNGFRLSLFGFEPDVDRSELFEVDELSEGEGPRANLKSPRDSLVLLKPTSEDEHEGGERMQQGSWQYNIFRAWIAGGGKFDMEADSKPVRLELQPAELVVTERKQPQQIRAVAWFDDGTMEDVTALTTFTSNDDGIAAIDDAGVVRVDRTGDTSVIAQYAGRVASAQVLVPAAAGGESFPPFPHHNRIDEFVVAKLRKLGVHPSKLSRDEDFLRRVYIDVIGALPTPEETREFLSDRDPEKREALIDRLLARPEYAMYWGMKFSDWTGNAKYISRNPQQWNWVWQQWIEEKLARNVPYDELVYGFICATSLDGRSREEYLKERATVLENISGRYNYDDGTYSKRRTLDLYWINVERRKPDTMLLQTANSFLGLRLECAQCHNHPFDRWTQKDFEGFKSFFMLTRYCNPQTGEEQKSGGRGYGAEDVQAGVLWRYAGAVKKTPPKLLGGEVVPYSEEGDDPRVRLWEWMRSADNPYFAPAIVNRLWDHYFGVGIVDPADDFNLGNPPSNPQLLKWLADDFVAHGFDLKHAHRTILNSRTYQLSWRPNDSNRSDQRNFSHALLRRMPAEVLIDAVADATGVPNNFGRLPPGRSHRAVGQASPPVRYSVTRGGYPMQVFGRPAREKTCDCERSNEPSVAQALYLANDAEILGKLSDKQGRLPKLLKSTADDRAVIRELYLAALSRFPAEDELSIQLEHVQQAASRDEGMRDVLWSLLNVREFLFIH
ncbi:MAG: DUF1549 and DUF1553 domain-containing protein [Pirellulaceae bacterium]|jgi:hypothetical protein|nr:DUF1549 and DUF1553 domain-containing protein [Pirellulaceae bacterium]MDP7018421.1 DUF1549 and DUF1553 domain-containing protein [Pirellulaceae bacterium]